MSFDLERLYALLPAIDRIRDTEQGQPLKQLLGVIQEQIAVVEEDLAQLYDDQFIETCADWVAPYIGDLIGYRTLYGVTPKISSPRAEVANTVGYRRRKGTLVNLEQVARDVTGWPARAVEFFLLLITTQYLNHRRPTNLAVPDLRRWEVLQWMNTPFDTVARTLDIRSIARRRGRYNIPNVGIFLWRLQPYLVLQGTARAIQEGCYTFDPLGQDCQLFNSPTPLPEFTLAIGPADLPEPLARRPLYADLETLRQGLADTEKEADLLAQSAYFSGQPVLEVRTGGTPIDPAAILVCDLSTWRRPPASLTYTPANQTQPPVALPIAVAVDPVLGRLAFPPGGPPTTPVQVSYSYGFSDDVGGGKLAHLDLPAPTATVSAAGPALATVLTGALATPAPVVEIEDSATYTGDLTLAPQAGQQVVFQARAGTLGATRPVIDGSITLTAASNAQVTLDGLLIAGHIAVQGTAEMTLILRDCTIRPWNTLAGDVPQPLATPAIAWRDAGSMGALVLTRSIAGRMVVDENVQLRIEDSIVDALGDTAVALAASDDGTAGAGLLHLERSTVFGSIHVREIDLVQNAIIAGPVTSERKQKGCLRFSYVPDSSRTPRRYECQPDLAIREALNEAVRDNPGLSTAEQNQIADDVRSRVQPSFSGQHYGEPAYGQLHLSCPVEIRTGAEDGAEMGVFHNLYQPQRETNLRIRLDEYLRFGLEAGIFYAT